MEKVLDIAKGLLAGFVELVKHPVSRVTELVQKEDIKKGAIKTVIIAAIMSIASVLTTIRAIYVNQTKSKYREAFMEELNPIVALFKNWGIYILGIAVVALVLFIIAKLVKDEKDYPYTLSMTVNSLVVYVVGMVLSLLLSFIWMPLSYIVITFASIYTLLTLALSFKESLTNVDSDKLVLVTTVMILIITVILAIVHIVTNEITLDSYAKSKFTATSDYSDLSSGAYKDIYKSLDDLSDLSSLSGLSGSGSSSSLSDLLK